jgi:hypothetical protein
VKKFLILPFRLLNSVPFGIVLMALTAAYIAAGSARPWFRELGVDEWPILRDWFDKTDMQFFNAWPLKTLMALLVANLIVVTWRRIPLTPPRYGVWCIHAGIITLICGTSLYYRQKVEGRIEVYKDARFGPTAVDHFYDKDQRSLYVRVGNLDPIEIPLPNLPRFKEYDEKYGNSRALLNRGLTGLSPSMEVADANGNKHMENLAHVMGSKNDLKVDVVGFYPYAKVQPDFGIDPASSATGVDVMMKWAGEPPPGAPLIPHLWTLAGSDAEHDELPESVEVESNGQKSLFQIGLEVQHRDADTAMVEAMSKAVGELFHLDVTVKDQKPIPLDCQLGKPYPVGTTGYTITLQTFDPAFSNIETGEVTPLLIMQITNPANQTFRRSVRPDRPGQTDFKIGGRMREKNLIDKDLHIEFHMHDPFQLLPQRSNIKHTLLTATDGSGLVDLVCGYGSVPSQVLRFPSGEEAFDIPMPAAPEAPFAGPMAQAASQPVDRPMFRLEIQRRDHLKMQDRLTIVPPGARDRNTEDEGSQQVAKLRVTLGNWSSIVYAPFADEPGDRLSPDRWHLGIVKPPEAGTQVQMQLGYTRRPLPVQLSLDQFDLVPYPGEPADSPKPFYRDYISHITLTDPVTGESYKNQARMNHPIYFNGGDWLFFQATYDTSPEHVYTGLGIGNRPARGLLWAGFIMICVGLMYAFYLKPIIVRRMKENAIAKATAEGKSVRKGKQKQLVAS